MTHEHATSDVIETEIRRVLESAETTNAAKIGDTLTEKFCDGCLSGFVNKYGGCCIYCAVGEFLTLEGWE